MQSQLKCGQKRFTLPSKCSVRSIHAFGLALFLYSTLANAQQLIFSDVVTHLDGIRPGPLWIRFEPQGAAVARYRMSFTYPPELFAPPVVSTCFANAQCSVDSATHTVTVLRDNTAGGALPLETACIVEFTTAPDAIPAIATFPVVELEYLDHAGLPIAGSSSNGNVFVMPGESSPLWEFSREPDQDCVLDANAEIGISPQPNPDGTQIDIVAVGTSNSAGTVAISCGVSAGFQLLGGGDQQVPGDQLPAPIELACTAQSPSTGSLICLEGSSAGERGYFWDLVCSAELFDDGFDGAVAR